MSDLNQALYTLLKIPLLPISSFSCDSTGQESRSTLIDEKCPPWFAVYVKARHEKCIALTLKGKGFEVFLPTHTKIHKNRKKFELPFFPGYVFCRMTLDNTLPVVTVPGVFSIIGTGREPQSVPDAEIEGVRAIVASGWKAYPWPYLSAGQEVYFESGPLRGLKGSTVISNSDKWLVVSVHLLQRSLAVKVDRESLPFGAIAARAQATRAHPYLVPNGNVSFAHRNG